MNLVIWCAAYVAVGVASFSILAAFNPPRDRIHVVKVKVNPVLIEGPTEVKR